MTNTLDLTTSSLTTFPRLFRQWCYLREYKLLDELLEKKFSVFMTRAFIKGYTEGMYISKPKHAKFITVKNLKIVTPEEYLNERKRIAENKYQFIFDSYNIYYPRDISRVTNVAEITIQRIIKGQHNKELVAKYGTYKHKEKRKPIRDLKPLTFDMVDLNTYKIIKD